MLAMTGSADTVSTVLRQTIRQLSTPDYLRGRMTSINMVFFMGGPQLGELEAGALAQYSLSPVISDFRRIGMCDCGIACVIAMEDLA